MAANEPTQQRVCGNVAGVAWEWLLEYNEERPHDSLDDMTPLEYRREYASQKAAVSTN